MADVATLNASVRDRVGKGSARAARREGFVPAVIYGDKKDPLPIQIEKRELDKLLNKPGFFSHLIDLKVGKDSHRVLPRDLQQHPVTDFAWHVDFLRVSATSALTVDVPVEFTNEGAAPGLKRGGVLNVVRHTVEMNCRADNIPEKLVIDLTGLEIGDSIHISAIALPEGATPVIDDRDFTIATIAAPTVVSETDAEEAPVAEDTAAEAEGEEESEES
ncbi:MAG: 50S ribosomal protein L25/general stress protein Ctc [Alphaproteobacteria bacterium]|nr:50S ribosomal protein L25/general stress protein Ctc [Alphaproteobacteria bacterium]